MEICRGGIEFSQEGVGGLGQAERKERREEDGRQARKQSFLSGLGHRKPSPELPKVLPGDKRDPILLQPLLHPALAPSCTTQSDLGRGLEVRAFWGFTSSNTEGSTQA